LRYYGKEAIAVPTAEAFSQVEPSSQHKALAVAVFAFLSSSFDFYSASVSTLWRDYPWCRLSLRVLLILCHGKPSYLSLNLFGVQGSGEKK